LSTEDKERSGKPTQVTIPERWTPFSPVQLFPVSKEVQDTDIIKQGLSSGTKMEFCLYYLEKGATITEKYYVALLDKLKPQLVSKRQDKLLKGILYLQDSVDPHKVAKAPEIGRYSLQSSETPSLLT
jgi:hypothetical protein